MEYYTNAHDEFYVIIKNRNNKSISDKLTPSEMVSQSFRPGIKIYEDLSKTSLKLFIESDEPIELIRAKISDKIPYLNYSYFIGQGCPNRVITDYICSNIDELNKLQVELGYKPSSDIIPLPGLTCKMTFYRYSGQPTFIIQDIEM